MPKIIYLKVFGLVLFMLSTGARAVDINAFCQDQVSANTRRAAWGLELRSQMLRECSGQNLRICSQPWQDKIVVQEQADLATLKDAIETSSMSTTRQWLSQAATRQLTEAAYMAFRGVATTPSDIANDIAQECQRQELRDLQAELASAAKPVLVYPACVIPGGAPPEYVQRCCSPDCDCDVYCQ